MDTFIFSKEFEDVLKRCILGVLEEFHTKKTISGGQRGIRTLGQVTPTHP